MMLQLHRLLACLRNFRGKNGSKKPQRKQPLREFVYLDELSLRSLLTSQIGDLPDGSSTQRHNTVAYDTAQNIQLGLPGTATADLQSKFQTSNSTTVQTSSKSVSQSWFGQFYAIDHIIKNRFRPITPNYKTLEELFSSSASDIWFSESELSRGEIFEFRVRLGVDPVYYMSILASEFSAIMDEAGGFFGSSRAQQQLREVQPIQRVLQRLLVGLIPIRATALDFVIVSRDGADCIVDRRLVDLGLTEYQELQVAGVTEHLAFWKDIRRVLFSDAEFSLLCRISRSGLQDSWVPVKLIHLFDKVSPEMGEQMSRAAEMAVHNIEEGKEGDIYESRLLLALEHFAEQAVDELELSIDREAIMRICGIASRTENTASGQKNAFDAVRDAIAILGNSELKAEDDARFRFVARQRAGLSPISGTDLVEKQAPSKHDDLSAKRRSKLLDVEVIAIYW